MLRGATHREMLLRSDGMVLYRAMREGDTRPVLLEVGSPPRELELIASLTSPCVARPIERTIYDGVPTLVLEDFDGVPLRTLLARPLPLGRSLRIASRIAEALAELHDEGVIHKNVKPDNVLVAADADSVKLVGFGIATRRAQAQTTVSTGRLIEGSLPYMSPEQTGLVNRPLDQRTDLYSLGVLLYEMFTGHLPFEANDPLEWVFCHVAREPTAPTYRVEGLPLAVSDIVMKLLAKSADDRYWTARGLVADLTRCLELWTSDEAIAPFTLGQLDVSERLHVSERLYGREAELDVLLAAFGRVNEGGRPELVLVSGYSGVGKSSLLRELHRPIMRARGSFITGKADQYNRTTPYSTIATALRDLVLETLARGEASIVDASRHLKIALGENARAVIDIIPELEHLVGEQPPLVPLPPAESKHRFLTTCQRFLGAFARRERPLTLFLDDLQWADAASLELLQFLITHPDTAYLLALGAYREAEVGPAHPVLDMVDAVRRSKTSVSEIHLGPLPPEPLTQLVADAVHTSREEASALARLVHRKTGGNPFFAIQFMSTLQRDGLLELDVVARAWRWDVARIEARDYTDNVVELMVQKIEALPDATRNMLKLAACIGTLADVRILSLISKRPVADLHRALEPAVEAGLVLRTERARQDGHESDCSYRFLHDRIQQAAHSLIAEGERTGFHLAIARSLLASRVPQDDHVFTIANHYLLGLGAIEEGRERLDVARFLLDAGMRAKAALAHRGALQFFSGGVSLLPPESWNTDYETTHALTFEVAECHWLTGDFEAAERCVAPLLARSRTTAEKFRVYGIQVRLHTIQNEPARAVLAGLEALRMIGLHWEPHPTTEEVQCAHDQVWKLLGERPIEALLGLPAMTDPEMQAAVDLVSLMVDPAYFDDWNLYCLLGCFVVSTSLRFGNSPGSFAGYGSFALLIGVVYGRFEDAARFARIANVALERPASKPMMAKVCEMVATVHGWVKPLRSIIPYVERGAREGEEIGDRLWGSYCASHVSRTLLSAGEALEEVLRQSDRCLAYVRKARYDELVDLHVFLGAFVRRLRGERPREDDISGNAEPSVRTGASPFVAELQRIWQLQEAWIMGDYARASRVSECARPHLVLVRVLIESVEYSFFDALTRAALWAEASPEERQVHEVRLAEHERSQRAWAASCRENFGAQHALIVAEVARIAGRDVDAEKAYEQAIAVANEAGLIHVEAIANEVAARFYEGRHLPSIARMYLRQSRTAYARWGADAKVAQLDRQHPELHEVIAATPSAIASRPEEMDLLGVIKASQTISGELDLERLTGRLIQVVLEHSGARLGRLLLLRDGVLRIESEATVTERGLEVRPRSVAASGSGLVPESVVHYVLSTRKSVALPDASAGIAWSGPGRFRADEYFERVRPRSVLCMPIVRGARVAGIFYLENNLVSHAFTPERVGALDLLASQAAITVEAAFWIRQEREARVALDRSESRFRQLSDSKLIGVICADRSGRILEANDYFLEMLGYTREDLRAERVRWTDLTPPEYAELDANALRELDATGICRPFEKDFFRKDRTRVPVLIAAANFDGTGSQSVAYVLDISDRRRAQEERDRLFLQEQAARAQAERALRAREEFLAIAAHELRTPLTPLKMQVEVLAGLAKNTIPTSTQGRAELLKLLEKSNRQLDRIVGLVGQLLEVSTASIGRMSLTIEDVDLGELVHRALERHRFEAEAAGCVVSLSVPEKVRGRWDPLRLEQVVVNLLTNAMKYGAGSPIEVTVAEEAGEAVIVVRDHGIGVDERDRNRIFERFERAVSVSHFGGFGLGLYTSREIVRAHGGTIRIESRRGVGSTFIVRLPLDSRLQ
jgi:PAS domain S-box-containing protein